MVGLGNGWSTRAREEDMLCLMCSYSIDDMLVVTVSTGNMSPYQELTSPTACFAPLRKGHQRQTGP